MIGVVAHQCREIECHGQSAAAVLEQVFVATVGLFRRSEPGELPHGEELAAVSGGVNTARVWRLSRIAKILFVIPVIGKIGLSVKSSDREAGNGGEAGAAMLVKIDSARGTNRLLWGFFQGRQQRLLRPLLLR